MNKYLNKQNKFLNTQNQIFIGLIVLAVLFIFWFSLYNTNNIFGLSVFIFFIFIIGIISKIRYIYAFLLLFIYMNNQLLLLSFEIFSTSISIQVIAYLIIILLCGLLLLDMEKIRNIKKMEIPLLFYLCWMGYLILNNICLNGLDIKLNLQIISLFLLAIIFDLLVKSKIKYSRLMIVFYFISIVSIVFIGYLEFFLGKTFFLSQWAGGERYRYGILRIGSTVADGNFMAALLIPAFFIFQTKGVKNIINTKVLRFIRFLIFIQIILTFSRTGWVVLAVTTLLSLCKSNKKMTGLIILSGTILLPFVQKILYLLYSIDKSSNSARELILDLAHNIWINNYWLGIGFGQFTNYSSIINTSKIVDALETMNTYYLLLTSSGIIGLSFFIVFIIIILKKYAMNYFNDSTSALIVITYISWLLMIYSLDCFYLIFFWTLPAIVTATHEVESNLQSR
ncbi:O-antigen ligase family protein [Turicibacter sanguinis]|uniref:O-antigen ligase family protein n=1 Tax=Turicibacter sanguinis TaxID=154288 RepID=UPI0011CBDCD0|nr:O-antigen ligase family protein [Turicibacter sanguinis]